MKKKKKPQTKIETGSGDEGVVLASDQQTKNQNPQVKKHQKRRSPYFVRNPFWLLTLILKSHMALFFILKVLCIFWYRFGLFQEWVSAI